MGGLRSTTPISPEKEEELMNIRPDSTISPGMEGGLRQAREARRNAGGAIDLGGNAKALPFNSFGERLRLGSGQAPDTTQPVPNAGLASSTNADGVPTFDNASIQRGVDQKIIADPERDSARIAGNQLQDRATTLRNLPRDVASGAVTPEAGNTINTTTRDEARNQIDRFRAGTDRQEAIADSLRNGPANQPGSQAFNAGAVEFGNTVANDLSGDPEGPGLNPVAVAATARAFASGAIPFDATSEDIGLLTALSGNVEGFDTIFGQEGINNQGPEPMLALVERMALNPGQRKFEDISGGQVDTGRIPEQYRAQLENIAGRARQGFAKSAAQKQEVMDFVAAGNELTAEQREQFGIKEGESTVSFTQQEQQVLDQQAEAEQAEADAQRIAANLRDRIAAAGERAKSESGPSIRGAKLRQLREQNEEADAQSLTRGGGGGR